MRKIKSMLFGIAALAFTATTAQAESMELRIGTEGAYPPFNYYNDAGELVGFDVDIANALCEAMDAKCTLVAQDWDGIIPGLLANKYDAIIASMTITEERKQSVDFTNKYYNTPGRFVAPKGKEYNDISPEALKGLVIGAQRATTHATYLEDNLADVATIKLYDTQENANLDLVSGRLDLILADSLIMSEWLKTDEGQGFHLTGPAVSDPKWYGEGIGIAVRKGDDELREKFNAALKQIRSDGTYKAINDKWFDVDIYGD